MEVIREIQDRYGQEGSVHGIYEPGDLMNGQVYQKNIKHWADVKDTVHYWSLGQIDRIDYYVTSSEWEFHISFPNWRGEDRLVVRINPNNNTGIDFIAPIRTHLLRVGSLQRNTPVSREIVRSTWRFGYMYVSVYISTEKETLMKQHKWCLGKLRNDGSVYLCNKQKKKKLFQAHETYITAPVSSIRHHEKYVAKTFRKLNKKIYIEVEKKKHREKEAKKQKQKENRKILSDIRKENKVVLNDLTLKFYVRKPMHVKKTCMAYKQGWVNEFGKPITWEHAHVFIKGISANVFRFMSTFMDGGDILRLACTNRKNNFDLMNFSFLQAQHKKLGKNLVLLTQIDTNNTKSYSKTYNNFQKLRLAIDKLGNNTMFKEIIDAMMEKKHMLNRTLLQQRRDCTISREKINRTEKKLSVLSNYM